MSIMAKKLKPEDGVEALSPAPPGPSSSSSVDSEEAEPTNKSLRKSATAAAAATSSSAAFALERDEFTSEIFKIEMTNLPNYYCYTDLKKLLIEKLCLRAHKIKLTTGGNSRVFVTFKTEEDRIEALKVLNGYSYKGNILEAAVANAIADPFQGKKRGDKQAELKMLPTLKEVKLAVQKAVTPWQDVPYPEQLSRKQLDVCEVMQKMTREIYNINPDINPKVRRINNPKIKYPEYICIVENMYPSPETNSYRNKCEFTIGLNPASSKETVGFRLSSYKDGNVGVGGIEALTHLPGPMKQAATKFQEFVRSSNHKAFDPVTHTGVWKQLTVRTTVDGKVMGILIVCTDKMEENDVDEMRVNIKKRMGLLFQSFYIKEADAYGASSRSEPVLLFGEDVLIEQLLGLSFRVSPEAFFQINVKATEVMYKHLALISESPEETTLLDICCGTGSIGLSCLKLTKLGEVLGIDLNPSAIVDAKMNADANNLADRCQFFCGKAEDLLPLVIGKAKFNKIVAVVDPPRGGLHNSVIHTLRNTQRMRNLVFVACDARATMKNFLNLAKPVSKRFRGEPFKPTKVIPVDMFPQTPHYDLLVWMERVGPSC